MEKQVGKDHYAFSRYVHFERWVSYYVQLKEVMALNPSTLLEVGGGDGVFGDYLKHHTDVSYKNVDIAEDLGPDAVGDVRKLPFPDNAFDTVVAFQILEHIPFEDFSTALQELSRVSKRHVIISLPHFGPRFQFFLKLPFLPEIKLALKLPFKKEHIFNGEHYWEIGKKDYGASRVRNIIKNFVVIEKEYVPFWNQYHRFYVCHVADTDDGTDAVAGVK